LADSLSGKPESSTHFNLRESLLKKTYYSLPFFYILRADHEFTYDSASGFLRDFTAICIMAQEEYRGQLLSEVENEMSIKPLNLYLTMDGLISGERERKLADAPFVPLWALKALGDVLWDGV
jgi:hypothetical protein